MADPRGITGYHSAGSLAAFGAVKVDQRDPKSPIVYRAQHQNTSRGFVELRMDAHSETMQKLKAQKRDFMARSKYAGLTHLAPGAKVDEEDRAQRDGDDPAPRKDRASLRLAGIVGAARTSVLPTKIMSVADLAMKHPQTKQASTLRKRMGHWAQAMGNVPGLLPGV